MSQFHTAMTPDAQQALNHMHHLLGRNRASAWWQAQSTIVRQGICRAAALKPVVYCDMALADMTEDEREAIRCAVVAFKSALSGFSATDRGEWLHVSDFVQTEQPEQPVETGYQDALQQQMERLQQRAEKMKAAQQ